jgi:DDE superfamily endonuclease
MFQDEARFGRMSDPGACWAPAPIRPVVGLSLVREFVYAYGAVSPVEGEFDWMIADKMNTETMDLFLDQIEDRFPDDFIIMVMDGASSHTTKELKKRDHLVPLILPPYSPELNPVEIIWDSLREGWFTNRVFESLDAVRKQVVIAMEAFADDDRAVSRLTAWPWIMQAIVSS